MLWTWLQKRRQEGRIALRGDESEENQFERNGPREVDVDGVWG